MATIITKTEVPDGTDATIVEAIAVDHGWTADAGVTKQEYFNQVIASEIKRMYESAEVKTAIKSVETAKKSEVAALDIKADNKV